MLLKALPTRKNAAHITPVVSPPRSIFAVHAETAMDCDSARDASAVATASTRNSAACTTGSAGTQERGFALFAHLPQADSSDAVSPAAQSSASGNRAGAAAPSGAHTHSPGGEAQPPERAGSCAPATPVAETVQLLEKRIAFSRWRAAVKRERPRSAALRARLLLGDCSPDRVPRDQVPDWAPISVQAGRQASVVKQESAAAEMAQNPPPVHRSSSAQGSNGSAAPQLIGGDKGPAALPARPPPEPALPLSTGCRMRTTAGTVPDQAAAELLERARAAPLVGSMLPAAENDLAPAANTPTPDTPELCSPDVHAPSAPLPSESGTVPALEGVDAGAAAELGALAVAAGEAGKSGASLSEAALLLFGDPALAARCQAALRGTHAAELAGDAAAGAPTAAAQHAIAVLTGAVEQLGGCLEAVLGQQQRFLAAAAAWEARAAVVRRQVHERAVAAASELLHARNALAEALAREQGLRADCEAKDAELATLRSLQAEPGRLQRPQRGRRVLKPEAPTTPAAVKQEVHFSHSAWLDLLRPG